RRDKLINLIKFLATLKLADTEIEDDDARLRIKWANPFLLSERFHNALITDMKTELILTKDLSDESIETLKDLQEEIENNPNLVIDDFSIITDYFSPELAAYIHSDKVLLPQFEINQSNEDESIIFEIDDTVNRVSYNDRKAEEMSYSFKIKKVPNIPRVINNLKKRETTTIKNVVILTSSVMDEGKALNIKSSFIDENTSSFELVTEYQGIISNDNNITHLPITNLSVSEISSSGYDPILFSPHYINGDTLYIPVSSVSLIDLVSLNQVIIEMLYTYRHLNFDLSKTWYFKKEDDDLINLNKYEGLIRDQYEALFFLKDRIKLIERNIKSLNEEYNKYSLFIKEEETVVIDNDYISFSYAIDDKVILETSKIYVHDPEYPKVKYCLGSFRFELVKGKNQPIIINNLYNIRNSPAPHTSGSSICFGNISADVASLMSTSKDIGFLTDYLISFLLNPDVTDQWGARLRAFPIVNIDELDDSDRLHITMIRASLLTLEEFRRWVNYVYDKHNIERPDIDMNDLHRYALRQTGTNNQWNKILLGLSEEGFMEEIMETKVHTISQIKRIIGLKETIVVPEDPALIRAKNIEKARVLLAEEGITLVPELQHHSEFINAVVLAEGQLDQDEIDAQIDEAINILKATIKREYIMDVIVGLERRGDHQIRIIDTLRYILGDIYDSFIQGEFDEELCKARMIEEIRKEMSPEITPEEVVTREPYTFIDLNEIDLAILRRGYDPILLKEIVSEEFNARIEDLSLSYPSQDRNYISYEEMLAELNDIFSEYADELDPPFTDHNHEGENLIYSYSIDTYMMLNGFDPEEVRSDLGHSDLIYRAREDYDNALITLPQQLDVVKRILRSYLGETEEPNPVFSEYVDELIRGCGYDPLRLIGNHVDFLLGQNDIDRIQLCVSNLRALTVNWLEQEISSDTLEESIEEELASLSGMYYEYTLRIIYFNQRIDMMLRRISSSPRFIKEASGDAAVRLRLNIAELQLRIEREEDETGEPVDDSYIREQLIGLINRANGENGFPEF
ncbi:MAG: hypothetical protein GX025_10305, partial [Clostridiales bacterium]|nr:hypothetical protein [Clostridiales bacterium]